MDLLERAARVIAASKRGVDPDAEAIDRVWTSYVGQARAVLAYTGVLDLLETALSHVQASAEARSMMDGFGPRHARKDDVDCRKIRIALGSGERELFEGELLRPAADLDEMRAACGGKPRKRKIPA